MNTSAIRKDKSMQKVLCCLKVPVIFLLCLTGIAPIQLKAQGDLLITPRRVVFEGNRQRQEITLANTGQDTARYSISFVQYRMTEEGTFEQIESPDPGQMFADEYLRYFPRTVTLAPQESQVVRMQLRRLPGMEDGEYRSHMYFRAVPDEKPLGEEDILTDTTAIGIRLTPIFGITIPIIIRVGEVSASVSISDVQLVKEEEGPPLISLVFNREGNQSVYGDLTVDYIPPQGEKTEIGLVRGIAVYTPNTARRFNMQLRNAEGLNLSQGKLLIRYSSSSEARPEVFAEKELLLQ
jgi:P pilus assembly chaperone PapD